METARSNNSEGKYVRTMSLGFISCPDRSVPVQPISSEMMRIVSLISAIRKCSRAFIRCRPASIYRKKISTAFQRPAIFFNSAPRRAFVKPISRPAGMLPGRNLLFPRLGEIREKMQDRDNKPGDQASGSWPNLQIPDWGSGSQSEAFGKSKPLRRPEAL